MEIAVSIPFKRESVLQDWKLEKTTKCSKKWFQFPSNGKVYCKRNSVNMLVSVTHVSIPFKRESVLQVDLEDRQSQPH